MSGILVIAEQRRGELRPVTLELVSAAQSVRRTPDERVAVAILAEEPDRFIPDVSVAGVDEIVTVSVAAKDFDPDALEAATLALIEACQPALVPCPTASTPSGVAALAVKGKLRFASDVFRIVYEGTRHATRGGYGQKVNVEPDFLARKWSCRAACQCIQAAGRAGEPGGEPLRSAACAHAARRPGIHRSERGR
jgi:electron transfer flavoprotein alpha subunit